MQIIEEPVDSGAGVGHWGTAVDHGGTVYCADEFQHRILAWSPGASNPRTLGSRGTGEGELLYPCGLCVCDETLWVADSWNHRIQGFDLAGVPRSAFGRLGSDDAGLQVPLDVQSDGQGGLWVADAYNHRVLHYPTPGAIPDRMLQGGRPDGGISELSAATSHVTGLVLYYPSRLWVDGDVVYVVDSRHVTRIGVHTIDALPLPAANAGMHPISAGPYHVDVYSPHTGVCRRYDFAHFEAVELFEAAPAPATLGVVGGVPRVLYARPLRWVTLDAASAETRYFERPVAPTTSPADAAAATLTADPLSLTTRLFADLPTFFELWAALPKATTWFVTADLGSPASAQNPETALPLNFLTPEGRAAVAGLEQVLGRVTRFNGRLAGRSAEVLADLSAAAGVAYSRMVAEHYFSVCAAVEARRDTLLQDLAAALAEPGGPPCVPASADGALFFLNRLLHVLFGFTRRLREVWERLGLHEGLQSEAPAGFFVAAAPPSFDGFRMHVLNCARFRDDASWCVPDDAGRAAEHYGPALKGVVLSGLAYDAADTPEARDLARLRRTAYTALLDHGQWFTASGGLYSAYGFAPSLMSFLLHDLWTDAELAADELIAELEPWASVPAVRRDMAAYYCLFPDPARGMDLMARLATDLEQTHGAAAGMDPTVFGSLYMPAVVQWAYYRGRTDLEAGLAVLERLGDHPDAQHMRAKLLLEHGRYEEALAACVRGDVAYWPLGLMRGMVHLCAGDVDAARTVFSAPVAGTPPHRAAVFLAAAHRTAGDIGKAAGLLEAMWDDPPETLRFHLGMLYRMRGDDHRALTCFQEQLGQCSFADNTFQLLITLRKLGLNAAYETALKTLPRHAFFPWDGRALLPEDPALGLAFDAWLALERAPRPAPGHADAARYARMLQAPLLGSMPMYFIDRQYHPPGRPPRYPHAPTAQEA